MDTNRLKRFAQAARKKLLDQVSSRLELILNTDSAELREKAAALSSLKQAINSSSKAQVIDKVAYTWFNRLMALRFMDVNDYQPLKLKVITPTEGFILPEILEVTNNGQFPADLPVNKQKINDLLDGKIPSNNAQNEIYKELLIGACNHLHSVFPFLFEKINDYTELLLPDDLTSEFSIVNDFIEGMQKEDCKEVEVIGWLYQFYISERKDEVFALKSKVKKEDIPAATQLFTPRWIVEYMVQNTVGKLWLQNNPNSGLREHMPYFIESPSVTAEDFLKVDSVEEITLLDQACGSGHILVYGFELFSKIYEEQGYSPSEIPQLIIEKNLYGFEIDERAAQLAGMALMMKARAYHRRIFKKEISPNILCFEDVVYSQTEFQEVLVKTFLDKSREFQNDLKLLENATNFGSLIIPESTPEFLEKALIQVQEKLKTADVFEQHLLHKLKTAIEQLLPLSKKYHCVVDNPPYMGGGKMNTKLSSFVKTNYSKSKSDLSACFIEAGLLALHPKGFLGMINQQSWMFLDYYKHLRKYILKNIQIDNLLLLGPRTFEEISGEVVQNSSFVLKKSKPHSQSAFFKLDNYSSSEKKRIAFLNSTAITGNQSSYFSIPDAPIGFWFSDKQLNIFSDNPSLKDIADVRAGLQTGDNEQFTREWVEVKKNSISFFHEKDNQNSSTWFIYNKGGSYRKWYGNKNLVVNWENNGEPIINAKLDKLKKGLIMPSNSKPKNTQYYFKEGLTWSTTGGKIPSFRMKFSDELFDIKGSSVFPHDEKETTYLLGLLNSKLTANNIKVLSPNLDSNPGYIAKLPVILEPTILKNVEDVVSEIMKISKDEYGIRETSILFTRNVFIKCSGNNLEDNFKSLKVNWDKKFFELQKKEEKLNHLFIEIYGLQEELTSQIPLEDITIFKEETDIVNGQLIFNQKEIFAQFMSYAVGCMFGRYSLDKEGLILANQGENLSEYLAQIQGKDSKFQSLEGLTFIPDEDNIIPVLDDEYFEDDIVHRFYEFLRVSFGKENFDKNLAFVEECLGKDVRKYFVKDFHKDHIKRYKKRPIYWMFSSPKGSFNVLIYMHRYTPNTLNQILNGYLLEYREKLKSRIEHLDHIIETGSPVEQTKAGKEKDKLKVVLLELQEYERETLYPLATERISIDLDDGVLVNYNKFGKAIQEVKGLNDKATKKKVREFDWIITEKII